MKTNMGDINERDWCEDEMDAVEQAMERRRHGHEVAVELAKAFAGLVAVIGLLIATRSVVRDLESTFDARMERESPTAARVAREAVANDAFACWCQRVTDAVFGVK